VQPRSVRLPTASSQSSEDMSNISSALTSRSIRSDNSGFHAFADKRFPYVLIGLSDGYYTGTPQLMKSRLMHPF
jgi:hypothetical protein